MLKFFEKLPKGIIAQPSSHPPQQPPIISIESIKKRKVGRPPSILKSSTSKLIASESSSRCLKYDEEVESERILFDRIQKDGTIRRIPVIILAGEYEYQHCSIIDDKKLHAFNAGICHFLKKTTFEANAITGLLMGLTLVSAVENKSIKKLPY